MWMRVLRYRIEQAFYDFRALLGYPVVLLSDPRWNWEPVSLEDLENF